MTNDGGVTSRKMWFCVGTSLSVILSGLFIPTMIFSEVVMGLISVCAIYVGGNAATKWVQTRHLTKTSTSPSKKKGKKDEEYLGE